MGSHCTNFDLSINFLSEPPTVQRPQPQQKVVIRNKGQDLDSENHHAYKLQTRAEKDVMESMSLHQHLSIRSFLILMTHGTCDFSLSPKSLIRQELRELQKEYLQGHQGWRRHPKGSTTLHQHQSVHMFLIWATHGTFSLSLRHK